MQRFVVMKHWTAGFLAGIDPAQGCDDTKNEHWQAGYLAGYKSNTIRNQLLDEYLISTGRKPQSRFMVCKATEPTT